MSPERIRPGSARTRPGSATRPSPGLEALAHPDEAPAHPDEVEATPPADAGEADTGAAVPSESDAAPGAAEGGATFTAFEDAAPSGEAPPMVDDALEPVPGSQPDGTLEARPAPEAAAPPAARPRGRFARLYYGQTRVEFVRRKRLWFMLSSIVILAGAVSLGVRGLNLGIDFVGGTAWTVQSKTFTVAKARNAVSPLGYSGATITVLGAASTHRTVEVQARLPKGQGAATTQKEATTVAKSLAKAADVRQEAVSIATVGPSWGSEITNKAIVALIVFFILIALYISIFFEWRMAAAAIVAVAHDILVTVGIYSLTGFQVTPDTVVAFLTILGYSLYDTIVVFDRVRDNTKRLGPSGKLTYSDLVNLSMNQTLARSINTSLVAIMPILSVLVLGAYVLGATTLEYFGLALLIGLTTGAYSSIFIASPLVAVLKEREQRWRNVRARLTQRGSDRLLLSPADIAAGILGENVETVAGGSTKPSARRSAPRARPARQGPVRPPSPARRKGGRR